MSRSRTPTTKKDLVTATADGDRLESLIALRDLIAERLQKSNSDRDTASMSRRLMQILEEIEALERERAAANSKKIDLEQFRHALKLDRKAN